MSTTPTRDAASLNHPMPFTLWTCEVCDRVWWALKPEHSCPNEECQSDEIVQMDYPEQLRCSVCNRDWRVAPVVRNSMCLVCAEGYRGD